MSISCRPGSDYNFIFYEVIFCIYIDIYNNEQSINMWLTKYN